MATKTLSAIILVIAVIFMLPLAFGLLGGLFGLIMGIFGAIFGVVAGVFGAVFGAIGSIFQGIGWGVGFLGANFFTVILVIVLLAVLAKRRN